MSVDRTYGAALLVALLVGGSLAGLGVFLGFPTAGAVWFGVIVGVLSGALLLAASRRADSFHPTADNAHLADLARPAEPTDAGDRDGGPAEADDTDANGVSRPADPDDPPSGAAPDRRPGA